MNRYYCVDESKELHELIKNNHEMLPGDQIDPNNPRRWLLVKHEMPVIDPGTGSERWSLDLFFLDQDATPTFVECKRFKDTRARREIVAQMVDYAANSHFYLDANIMNMFANETSMVMNKDLHKLFNELATDFDTISDFFERAEQNLKDGRVRLIFLLEDSPNELRTLVSFLNNQMIRTEVLIVELKLYVYDGLKVVNPNLYGYTEQAYVMKKDIERKETRSSVVISIDDESFYNALEERSGSEIRNKAEELFKLLDGIGATRSYSAKSVKLSVPKVRRTIILLGIDGSMYVDVSWAKDDPLSFQLIKEFIESFGIPFHESLTGKQIKPKDAWSKKIDTIVELFKKLNIS
ncbi:MAG: hypothetical protein ACOY4F_13490 [Thermodesulfobacteriota bacterium]